MQTTEKTTRDKLWKIGLFLMITGAGSALVAYDFQLDSSANIIIPVGVILLFIGIIITLLSIGFFDSKS